MCYSSGPFVGALLCFRSVGRHPRWCPSRSRHSLSNIEQALDAGPLLSGRSVQIAFLSYFYTAGMNNVSPTFAASPAADSTRARHSPGAPLLAHRAPEGPYPERDTGRTGRLSSPRARTGLHREEIASILCNGPHACRCVALANRSLRTRSTGLPRAQVVCRVVWPVPQKMQHWRSSS